MIKDILRLLDIQDIDLKVIDLKKLQVELPETLKSLFDDIDIKKKELEAAQKALQDVRAHQKNLEVEVESNKQALIKHKNSTCPA